VRRTPTPDDRLLRVEEVCQIAGGVNRTTIYRWSRSGRMPSPRQVGGRCFFLRSEIQAWLASLPKVPGAPRPAEAA